MANTIKSDLARLLELESGIRAMKAEQDDVRRRLTDRARATYEEEGAAPTWRTDLGTVYLTVPKPKVEVFDEDEFTKSAESILGPGCVEQVRRVRQELRSALLRGVQATTTGIPVTEDGEPVGGVLVMPRPPFLGVKLAKVETSDPF